MESIPNIYAIVPYFDRVQISKEFLFGEHSTMKVVSYVRGGVIVHRWLILCFSSNILFHVAKKSLCLLQWNLKSEISSKCSHNLLLSEEMIHRNDESPLISTHLRSPNVREFFHSILFLLRVAGYLVRTHLLFVFEASSELQIDFEKVKCLMIPSSMIELRILLDRRFSRIIQGSASGSNMLGSAYWVKSIALRRNI
ncbi:hypothetical protein M9H77_16920 [Catharanthus roseus]|uniref:Uncharacterized protein n=1 Tax=Catharanthus roseus TaxID=4058 RepID=A0ACC0B347_CATRO|nr:hypothetical protein M9H77_16920 [Catharanthus roseus]